MSYLQIIKEYKTQGFTVRYSVDLDAWERPNDVYGIWKVAPEHEGGVTVQWPGANPTGFLETGDKWWVSCNVTPAELAKDYAKQGRENPSREAYKSLQDELCHYLEGVMLYVQVEILKGGEVLAGDGISFDFSDYIREDVGDYAMSIAREHFSIKSLIHDAKKTAREKAYRHLVKSGEMLIASI